MAQFTYTDDVARVFPGDGSKPALEVIGLAEGEVREPGHVRPGDVVEADENPHPAFFEEVKAVKQPTTKQGD